MIDSGTKDLIIEWLIEQFGHSTQFRTAEIEKKFAIHDTFVRLFLKQLEQRGMLDYSEMGGGYVLCYPTMELYDFHRYGGFTTIEDGLLKNIQKLDLELQSLQSKFPKKIEAFANVVAILQTVSIGASKIFGHFT